MATSLKVKCQVRVRNSYGLLSINLLSSLDMEHKLVTNFSTDVQSYFHSFKFLSNQDSQKKSLAFSKETGLIRFIPILIFNNDIKWLFYSESQGIVA